LYLRFAAADAFYREVLTVSELSRSEDVVREEVVMAVEMSRAMSNDAYKCFQVARSLYSGSSLALGVRYAVDASLLAQRRLLLVKRRLKDVAADEAAALTALSAVKSTAASLQAEPVPRDTLLELSQ